MSNFAVRPQNTPLNISYQIAWERQYQQLLIKFLQLHDEFDGSAVAAWMRTQGLHDPDHHNHWGAQIPYYANLGWMTAVGKGVPTGAAHVSSVRIWKSNKYSGPRRIVKHYIDVRSATDKAAALKAACKDPNV